MVVEPVDYNGNFRAKGIAKGYIHTPGSDQRKPLNLNATTVRPYWRLYFSTNANQPGWSLNGVEARIVRQPLNRLSEKRCKMLIQ